MATKGRTKGRLSVARIAPRVAIAAVVVGVFCTWLAEGDLTLNGIEGPNNGWLCILLAGAAFLWTRMMERGSWVGVVGVLASALVIGWTAAANWHDARDVLDAGVSYGLLLVLVASAVLVAAAAVRAVSLLRDPARRARPATARGRARAAAEVVLLVLALPFVVVFQQVLGITQDPSWPPPPDAVTAAEAEAATEAFVAREGVRPHDAALDFARSTAATIEPWVEGANFFPRIFADVEAARSSVHILMFGWREGDVGTRMAALLERKLREGVEVRVIVDRFGSRPYDEAQEMFEGLADAGAQIVVNDVLPVDRDGLYPDDRGFDWRQDEVGRADHRKLYVVDGAVAWTGGAGIEDHFENGGFHDVMVRVTGDVVRQAQAAFLTSFRGHGGPLPDDLARYFPAPADPGTTPVALAQVIPGGFVAASQAIREQIDGARRRLDVMNPYLTDRDMLERDPRRRSARRPRAARRLRDVEQRPGDGGAEAPVRRSPRSRGRDLGAARDRRPREGGRGRRRRQLRHREPRLVGALPELGDRDDRAERSDGLALRGTAVRAGYRPVAPEARRRRAAAAQSRAGSGTS